MLLGYLDRGQLPGLAVDLQGGVLDLELVVAVAPPAANRTERWLGHQRAPDRVGVDAWGSGLIAYSTIPKTAICRKATTGIEPV